MNYSFYFTLLTLLNYGLTAPIPVPIAEPDVVIYTYHATTTVPVAEVLISDGVTYTIQLTTLETEAETSTTSQSETTSTLENVVAQAAVIATTSSSSTIAAPTTTSEAAAANTDCSTSVSVDSNGVAHVILTVAQTVVVNGAGEAVTTYNGATENTSTSAETTQDIATMPTTSSTSEVAYTTSSTTSPDTTSSTSEIVDTTSSISESPYVTTWANGEVFYSTLPTTLVSAINVAPVVAFTTVTANTLTSSATGLLSLVTSNGSVLLGTLTEGLTKDKNVANTMANPATVALTNSLVTTTAIPYSSSTSTTSTSSSTSTTSTSSTTSSSISVDNVAVLGAATTSSNGAAVGFEQTTSSTSSIDLTTIETTSSTSTSSTEAAATTSSSSGYLTKVPYSIVYSPYEDDGSCKDYSTVLSDLELIKSKGISELRIYGNDCNYMTTVLKVSKDIGLMINQGFWISSAGADSIDDAVTDLITYVTSGSGGYGWEIFSYFTIGNEAIISDYCTVDELISKISSVKSQLQNAGYTGKVTTSEPPVSFENNPSLCTASEIDFVGINPHSYFDASASASDAGTFVSGQIDIVKGVCGDLDIVVTETGYPNAGNVNGNNVPSAENQLIAVQSILDVVGTDVTILTTFEDLWKSPGEYNIEQHFGIIQILE